MASFQDIIDAVVAGDIGEMGDLTRQALDEGVPAMQVINEGMVAGLRVVGDRYEAGEMFLSEMLLSALTVKAGMEVAMEGLRKGEYQPKATMVLGTVRGDVHDIGKNLVGTVLECNGFEVVDLGVDVGPEKFVSAVREHKPEFLGMSALISTCTPEMKDVIEALTEAGLRDGLKIVIGGPPVSQDFASQIGADGYARDAPKGVKLLEGWLK